MKKMITLLSVAAVALTFSLLSFGCTEHKAMEPMGTKTESMPATTTDTMKTQDTTKKMPASMDTMKDQEMKKEAPMDNTKATGMKKEMPGSTNDKSM